MTAAPEKKRRRKLRLKIKKRKALTLARPDPTPALLPTDEALAHLSEVMASPLGKVWLDENALAPRHGAPVKLAMPGVVAPLPRRKMIAGQKVTTTLPPMARREVFTASTLFTMWRLVVWVAAGLRFQAGVIKDWVIGKRTTRDKARRLRWTFERLGPSFIKLGQQLAIRADVLPYEYCEELSEMLDRVEPMPFEVSRRVFERSIGRRLEDCFALFDPTPIGSASLACVYQAVLESGEHVAVKIRRPGVSETLAADVRALAWLMELAEVFSAMRAGMTENFRYELANMLREEVDFYREARYTTIFRTQAAENEQDYVTAPKVFYDFTTEEVLVTEYVTGVFLNELLGAIDRQDEQTLSNMRTMGIDPVKVAQHLCMTFNWETLENLLFHGDPHPANIVVKPDNTLVFIDFGSIGHFTSKHKRLWGQWHYYIAEADVQGLVEVAVALLEPLPPIDMNAFTKELEVLFWDWVYAMKSPDALWWEKASGVMWIKFVDISRRHNVPVNLGTLRVLRKTFLFDTVIFRLWKDLDLATEYKRYARRSGARARKRVQKDVKKRLVKGLLGKDYLRIETLMRMSNQVIGKLQHFLDTPRHDFASVIDKAAFGLRVTLQVVRMVILMFILTTVATFTYNALTGRQAGVIPTFVTLFTHPIYQIIPLGILLLIIRKVMVRISDVDIIQK